MRAREFSEVGRHGLYGPCGHTFPPKTYWEAGKLQFHCKDSIDCRTQIGWWIDPSVIARMPAVMLQHLLHSSGFPQGSQVRILCPIILFAVPNLSLAAGRASTMVPENSLEDGVTPPVKTCAALTFESACHLVGCRREQLRRPMQVRSLPHGTTPQVCVSPQLRMAFARAMAWEQPVWEIDILSTGKPLSTIVLWVCNPPPPPHLSAQPYHPEVNFSNFWPLQRLISLQLYTRHTSVRSPSPSPCHHDLLWPMALGSLRKRHFRFPSSALCPQIFDELALYDALGLDQSAVRRFALLVERGYQLVVVGAPLVAPLDQQGEASHGQPRTQPLSR